MIRYVKRVTKNPRKTIRYLEEINVYTSRAGAFLNFSYRQTMKVWTRVPGYQWIIQFIKAACQHSLFDIAVNSI
jgi:hypothetical protein